MGPIDWTKKYFNTKELFKKSKRLNPSKGICG